MTTVREVLPRSGDVVIVGGGVIGCSIAYYLAKAGRSVVVLEQGEIGGAASSAAAGMLTPFAEDPQDSPLRDFAMKSLGLYPDLASTLLGESGVDIEFAPLPLLMIAPDDDAAASLRPRADEQSGFEPKWLDPGAVRSLEPMLTGKITGALRSVGQGHVNARRLVIAFRRAATAYGARFFEFTGVEGLVVTGRRVAGVRAGGETMAAGVVVVAAGAWTGSFAAQVGTPLPVKPIRGQIVALLPQGPSLRHICFLGHRYICPKLDGSLLVGSTQEDAGFDDSTTVEGVAGLLQLATSIVPTLKDARIVDSWAGLRPGTSDGLPLLGPVRDLEGVIVASGHFRRGILLAPVTGMAVAQMLTNPDAGAEFSWLSPGRFRGN